MDYILENEQLRAKIITEGAELKSLVKKSTGQEYMWKADPQFWGRTSPVLFPQVGKAVDDTYTYGGKTYTMYQHGFARDKEFTVVSSAPDEVWMELHADADTKEHYPFAFGLFIGYRLEGSALRVLWKVVNEDDGVLYFSIGGHPAFNCPIGDDAGYEGYYLDFHTAKEALVNTKFGAGYLTDETEELALAPDGTLRMTEQLFAHDALVIEKNQTQAVSLMTPEGQTYLTVRFDAPLFGIWTPPMKNAPFVCIEPWYGRADREHFKGTLAEREWEQELAAGAVFEASYEIVIA